MLLVGMRNGCRNSARMPNATAPTTSSRSSSPRMAWWRYGGAALRNRDANSSYRRPHSAAGTAFMSPSSASSSRFASAPSRSSSLWRQSRISVLSFVSFFLAQCFCQNVMIRTPQLLVSVAFSTATNASCGILTWPICFMRFLPSFCFSSSLRFRVMSPP